MSDKTVEFFVENPIPAPDPGKTVTDEMPGRYEVVEELARGGSGRILVVFDRHVGRKIAMKELLSDINKNPAKTDDPQETAIRNRFLREARVTGRLEHPSIVPVYEIGRHTDGSFYYTMRLVKGKTLLSAIKKCRSVSERLELLPHFYHVCNAVAYAHSKGVINRDLKPSNVMIGEFGETVVLDWGLAKIKDSDEVVFVRHDDVGLGKTVVGQAIGTPSYMPPEQAEGKIGEIDEISDIYSLGAILYQILTGRTPFTGRTVDEIIQKVLNEKAENAVKKDKRIPPELAAIAEKALSKDKNERYSSVSAFIDDLTAYMSGRKVGVYRYSVFESLKLVATRHKAALVSSILIISIVLLAALQIMIALNRTTAAKNEAERGKVTANYRTAQAFSEKSDRLDAGKSYIASRIYAAAAMYYNPVNKKSPEYSPHFTASSGDAEAMLSGAASKFYIKNFHRGAVFDKDVSTGCRITAAALSDSENIVATGCGNGEVSLYNFPELSQIYKFDLENGIEKFRFSSDGRKLDVLLSDGRSAEINISDKTAETSSAKGFDVNEPVSEEPLSKWYQKENEKIVSKAVSPDGQYIFAGTEKGRIAVFSAKTGEVSNVLSFRSSPLTGIDFQKDGSHFITASKEGKAVIWDATKQIPLFAIDGHDSPVVSAFFAGSDYIVTAGEDGLLRIWKRHGKRDTLLLEFAGDTLRKAASAKGFDGILAFSGSRFSIVSKSNDLIFENTADFEILDADLSKDGEFIALSGKSSELKLYDMEEKLEKGFFLEEDEIFSVKISPDTSFIAASGKDKIYLVSRETSEIKSSACENSGAQSIDFSPDGKKIAAVCGDGITFLSVPSFKEEGKIEIEGRKALSLEFMRDSSLVAGFDKGILSHINTLNNSIMDFTGKLDFSAKIAVSDNGLFAASTAENQIVKLWNLRDHKLMLTISTDKEPACVLFGPEKNSLGICLGGNVRFYPLDVPDLELPPAELLRKMELEAGMELKDFYLKTLTSEDISQRK